MKTYFVDTNLFIRYLTNDDTEKANRVEALLDKASLGKVRLITCEVVLSEAIYDLTVNIFIGHELHAETGVETG